MTSVAHSNNDTQQRRAPHDVLGMSMLGLNGRWRHESPRGRSTDPPRLVSRNLPFNQSKNKMNVEHNQGWKIYQLVRHDIFHFLLRRPTFVSLGILLVVWTMAIIFFAGMYYAADRQDPDVNCGLGPAGKPISFNAAFAFSLETCTTVGYGLPSSSNAFFENCPNIQVVIYFHMTFSMLYNALIFAFFYSRVAKCDARAVQVVFSTKAIVSATGGQVRFQFRVYDVDAKYPHVRLYAVTKDRPVPRPLRVFQPNDELGATLLLSLPTVVAHHIDIYSILHPRRPQPMSRGLILRQVDSATCNREEVICPICAESYGTHERWVRHVHFQQIVERKDEYPEEGTHLSLTEEDLVNRTLPEQDLPALKKYFQGEISEVVAVVEGIDPLTSGTFQALQSYRFDDVVWSHGAAFHPCVEIDGDIVRVDLDLFHDMDFPLKNNPAVRDSLRTHDSFLVCNECKQTVCTCHAHKASLTDGSYEHRHVETRANHKDHRRIQSDGICSIEEVAWEDDGPDSSLSITAGGDEVGAVKEAASHPLAPSLERLGSASTVKR